MPGWPAGEKFKKFYSSESSWMERGAGRYTKQTDFTKKADLFFFKCTNFKKLDVCILVFVGVSSHCVWQRGSSKRMLCNFYTVCVNAT